jgi:uncharacterized protein (TIGR02266 family)
VEFDAELAAIDAGRLAGRHVRPELVEARSVLEAELVITPGMDAALEHLGVALRSLYALEAATVDTAARAIGESMQALQRALSAVQGEISQHGSLLSAGERVARSLAMLYPAAQALELARSNRVELAAQAQRERVARAEAAWSSGPGAAPVQALGEVEVFAEAASDEHEAILLMPRKALPKRVRRPVEFVPPAPTDANRRYSRRVELDVDIGLHSETNFFVGFAEDISDGGLFVATYDLLPVGTELTLSLVLPGGKQVVVSGRVTWIRDPNDDELAPGVGVRFQRLDEDDRAAIDRFLKQRPPMFFES